MKAARNLILTLLAIVLLTVASTVPAVEAEPTPGSQTLPPTLFNDVNPSDPDALYINYLAHKEIMKGYPDGGFHPRDSLTRAQAATVIAIAMNLTPGDKPSSFKDVAPDHWAYKYINAATDAGYLKGYPDGSFHPDRELSRAEGISLVLRLSKQETKDSNLPQLKDVPSEHWAASPIAAALEAGMTGLTEDKTRFLPDSPFSRGSLARALSILLTRDPELYRTELIGTLKPIAGQITLTRAGQNQTIKQEITLQTGDLIKSSSQSSAEINYPDGSAVLIKENTQISIKESQGRTTIKKDGNPGTAVDWLNLDMKQGTIFSALATRHQNQLETQTLGQKTRLLASLGLIGLADKAQIPWYQAADQKKVKMKVDMPWGAAAVRGTFISITVEPGGRSEVSCLTGDAEVSSNIPNNQIPATVVLQGGQSSTLTGQNAAPEPPAPLNEQQRQQFIQEQSWVETTARNMDENQEAIITPAPTVEQTQAALLQVPTTPQQPQNNIENQTQQALSTLEIVKEALETENTAAPVQNNNPVEESSGSSNPEKSLGQTVTLTPNHPLSFAGGIKLDLGGMSIPAGATVRVTEVDSSDLITDAGLSVAGKIIDIDFANLSITEPVELTLPLAGADPTKAAIYYYNNGIWEYQPTWLENGALKTRLNHFSIYAVLIDQTPPAGVQISKGSSTTSSVELILIATDSGGVARYQIYRDGQLLTTTTASAYTDTGLENGRSYTYKVKAEDRFGNNSGFSPELQVVLEALPPNSPNRSPAAGNVTITGTASVGEELTGNYDYSDPENDPEGTSIFHWYRGTLLDGSDKVAIEGAIASTYTISEADNDKYIFFEVTPVAGSGTSPGSPVLSMAYGPVAAADTPMAVLLSLENYSTPVPGSLPGTTKIATLNLPAGATRWQFHIQSEALGSAPALDSTPVSITIDNYPAGNPITIPAGWHLILYATDDDNHIKAYADMTVSSEQIASINECIAGGYAHTLALKSDGTVAAWGYNGLGECDVPAGLSRITAIATRGEHSLALKSDGTVVAWGNNGFGECDIPAGLNGVIAIAAGDGHSLALKSDGTVVAWGYNDYGECDVPIGLSGVTTIAAGGYHSLALKSDGTVVAWGNNYEGECDVPAGLNGVMAITASYYHSLALKSNGTVATWGYNDYGECDVPIGLNGITAIAAGAQHSLALKADGSVAAWGYNEDGECDVPAGLSGVAAISAGAQHSLALKNDGTVVAWGYNEDGECNLPTSTLTPGINYSIPQAGSASGTIKISSLNLSGITGGIKWQVLVRDDGLGAPLPDGTVNGAVDYTAGADIQGNARQHILLLATDDDSKVKAYTDILVNGGMINGAEAAPLLAAGSDYSEPVPGLLPGTTKIETLNLPAGATRWQFKIQIDALDYPPAMDGIPESITIDNYPAGDPITIPDGWHLILYATDEESFIKAYADITVSSGQITYNRYIAAGGSHSLALKSDGTIVAWGLSGEGQCNVPVGLSGVTAVSSRHNHSLALKSDGTVVAWGYNHYGQCNVPAGLNGVKAISAGGNHSLALKSDGTVIDWGLHSVPANLSGVTAIAAGSGFSLALKSNGTVVAGGDNQFGECNVPAGLSSVTAVSAGYDHSLVLKSNGRVVAWGYNGYGQCNVPAGLSGVTAIAAGGNSCLALKSNGTVVAWGDNRYGQCNVPSGLASVIAISAGGKHSLALKNDGTVVAWGDNHYGQCNIPIPTLILDSNYSAPEAGSAYGTVKISTLNLTGIAGASKWQVLVRENGLGVPLPNDAIDGAIDYITDADIPVTVGQHILLLATDNNGRVKAYTDIPVNRPVFLACPGNYSVPEAGSIKWTTRIPSLNFTEISGATRWQVKVQNDAPVIPSLDSQARSLTVDNYNAGRDITIGAGQHLILYASDDNGNIKGFADIIISLEQIASGSNDLNERPIGSSSFHSLALKNDGTVAAWGLNNHGQCNVPAELGGVTAVAAGYYHSLALKNNGTVTAWGNNGSGQCNVPAGLSGVTAITVGNSFSLALKSDGTVISWGSSYGDVPAGLNGIIAISAGMGYSLALKSDGTVVAWGNCDIPTGLNGVTSIAAGDYHSFALKNDGTVVAWGSNNYGQCDMSFGLGEVKAVAAGTFHSMALKSDGTVVAWGDTRNGKCDVPVGLNRVTAIAAGEAYSMALKSDGTVVVWGNNYGDDHTVPTLTLVLDTNYSVPQTGSASDNTKINTLNLSGITGAKKWQMLVRDDGLGVPLPDGTVNGAVDYTAGEDISISAGQHILLLATDDNGKVKAYADIAVDAGMISGSGNGFAGGTGTEEDPYIINTAQGLDNVRNDLSAYYRLGADIDLDVEPYNTGEGWLPIGDFENPFLGKFNGAGYSINNLYINRPSSSFVGLFSYISTGELKNIHLINALVSGYDEVGGLAGYLETGTISNSYFDGTINAQNYAGGLVGDIFSLATTGLLEGGIKYSYSVGSVNCPTGNYVGGLAGCGNGIIRDSYSIASVNGVSYVGGLIGEELGSIYNSYAAGNVSGTSDIGGLIGSYDVEPYHLYSSYYDTNTTNQTDNTGKGTPKTTAEMKQQATYEGWDFTGIWTIDEGNDYPRLRENPNAMPTATEVNISGTNAVGETLTGSYTYSDLENDPEGNSTFQWYRGTLADGSDKAPIEGATTSNYILTEADADNYIFFEVTPVAGSGTLTGIPVLSAATGQVVSGFGNISEKISVGYNHTLVVCADNKVRAWGCASYDNEHSYDFGQAVVPENLGEVKAVAAGAFHSLALRTDGTVVAWGAGTTTGTDFDFGQSIVPTGLNNVKTIAAGYFHSLALKEDGTVAAWGWGDVIDVQITVPAGLNNVKAIAAGYGYSLALKNDGTVVSWGRSDIAVPSGLSDVTAIAAGLEHALALKTDGTVVAWGHDNTGFQFYPTQVPVGLDHVKAIAAGQDYSLALKDDGTLVIWGGYDEIGVGDPFNNTHYAGTASVPPELNNVIAIASGNSSSIAIKSDGSLVAWGYNGFGHCNVPPNLNLFCNIVCTGADLDYTNKVLTLSFEKNIQNNTTDDGALKSALQIAQDGINYTFLNGGDTVNINGSDLIINFDQILTGDSNRIKIAANTLKDTDGDVLTVDTRTDPIILKHFAGGSGTEDDPYIITAADGLNDIRYNLNAHFKLEADIDLNVAPYNSGGGWVPIGNCAGVFKGVMDGNNHIISNLYINRPAGDTAWTINSMQGLFGYLDSPGEIKNLKLENAHIQGGRQLVGALLAYNKNGSVSNVFASGSVAGASNYCNYIGGLAGYNSGTIIQSCSSVSVTGTQTDTGGLVGRNTGTISDSFAEGNVAGCSYAGGLVASNSGTISNSYACGYVSGSGLGGLVGSNSGTINSSYYDADTTGQSDTGKGVPKTTAEMQQQATYSGWDFESIWSIDEGNGYPRLKCFDNVAPALATPGNYSMPEAGSLPGTTKIATLNLPAGATRWQFKIQSEALGIAPVLDSTPAAITIDNYPPGNPITIPAGWHLILYATDEDSHIKAYADITVDAEQIADLTVNRVYLAAGGYHSLALKGDGTVAAWGDNIEGQCNVPAGLNGVTAIAGGAYNSFALKGDGTVAAWGQACDDDQFSVPDGLSGVTAIASGANPGHILVLKGEGTVEAWGTNNHGQCDIPTELSGITSIAANGGQSLVLKSDGTVIAWGENFFGECDIPVGLSGVMAIATGRMHTLALKSDGTVIAWGSNEYGQCNVPAGLTGVTAIATELYYSLALKGDGTVAAWGDNTYAQCNVPVGLTGVTSIAAGGFSSLALKNDGTVVAWGDNSHGQCNILTSTLSLNTNYYAPQAGLTSGTTKISTLDFTGITGATKWQVLVRDNGLGVPLLDGTVNGAVDYNAGDDISINAGQHILLLATDDDGKVKAYKDLTVNAEQIKTGTSPPAYQSVAVSNGNKTVTLIFDKDIVDNTATEEELKEAVTFAADGTNFVALTGNDTVAVFDSVYMQITFETALTGSSNKIRIAPNTLKDADGNVLDSEVKTESIEAVALGTPTTPGNLQVQTGDPQPTTLCPVYTVGEDYGVDFGYCSFTFTLPDGIEMGPDDEVLCGNSNMTCTVQLVEGTQCSILTNGNTVSIITNGHHFRTGDWMSLVLYNNTLPAGEYTFRAVGDADGPGTDKLPTAGTGSETAVFTVTE